MARNAVVCHLFWLVKDGEEIPEDPYAHEHPVTEELKVSV
jgi:hypothetical protein